jgi:hypothetical protein
MIPVIDWRDRKHGDKEAKETASYHPEVAVRRAHLSGPQIHKNGVGLVG